MGVVVPGQEVPCHRGEATHPLQRAEQGLGQRGFHVVHVARDQDVPGALRHGKAPDRLDGVEPGAVENLLLRAEAAEHLADLPVGRVDEAHRAFSHGAPGLGTGSQVAIPGTVISTGRRTPTCRRESTPRPQSGATDDPSLHGHGGGV